jgi:integrase/recombinase XerD
MVPEVKMNEHIKKYAEYLEKRKTLSKNTSSAYIRDLTSFNTYIEQSYDRDLTDVTKTMILTYVLDMQKKSKNASTVSRGLSSIKSFYKYLENGRIIEKNPSNGIQAPRIEKKMPRFLTVEEIEKLLEVPDVDTVKGCRDKAMLELLYSTGIKVSELLDLKISSYSKYSDSLRIVKSKNSRHVPVGETAKKHLEMYMDEYRQSLNPEEGEDTLFLNVKGKSMSRQGFWKIIKSYAKSVNIQKDITPQIIRNSFVVHLLQNGADVGTLNSLFGQNSISMIQSYLKSRQNKTFEIYKRTHPRS